MKTALIANEKAIVRDISKAFQRMESAKRGYVCAVIELGEKLILAKEKVPHGQWTAWLKANSEFGFDDRQAQKYMMVSSNKLLVLEYFSDENSVNQLTKAIADATPEQLEKVEQLKREAEEKAAQAEAEKKRKAAELEAKRVEEETLSKVQTKEPEIIEGEFEEVSKEKPKEPAEDVKPGFVQVEAEHLEELQDRYHETISVNESLTKEIDSIVKVFESNDQLTTAAAEIKRLTDTNTALDKRLQGHLNSWQNERRELIGTLNAWKRRAEKAEKKLAELGHGK